MIDHFSLFLIFLENDISWDNVFLSYRSISFSDHSNDLFFCIELRIDLIFWGSTGRVGDLGWILISYKDVEVIFSWNLKKNQIYWKYLFSSFFFQGSLMENFTKIVYRFYKDFFSFQIKTDFFTVIQHEFYSIYLVFSFFDKFCTNINFSS